MRLKFNNINISLMKKYIMVAAVASVALASCTKNEVKPVEIDQEITYQTITTKTASNFASNRHFTSYAYMLPLGRHGIQIMLPEVNISLMLIFTTTTLILNMSGRQKKPTTGQSREV